MILWPVRWATASPRRNCPSLWDWSTCSWTVWTYLWLKARIGHVRQSSSSSPIMRRLMVRCWLWVWCRTSLSPSTSRRTNFASTRIQWDSAITPCIWERSRPSFFKNASLLPIRSPKLSSLKTWMSTTPWKSLPSRLFTSFSPTNGHSLLNSVASFPQSFATDYASFSYYMYMTYTLTSRWIRRDTSKTSCSFLRRSMTLSISAISLSLTWMNSSVISLITLKIAPISACSLCWSSRTALTTIKHNPLTKISSNC